MRVYPLLLALALVACASDPAPLCNPGAQSACACLGGLTGIQVCGTDRVLGTCICPDGGEADVSPADVRTTVDVPTDLNPPSDATASDAADDLGVPTDAAADASLDAAAPSDIAAFDAPDAPATDLGFDLGPDTNTPDAPAPDVLPPGCSSTTVSDCCGVACATTHATPACLGGTCTIASCADGFDDCDRDATTGCEADLHTSVAHCGACNHACPARINATPTCAAGVCGLTCATGYGDCDGDATNGCETSLLHGDLANCGACGHACPAAPLGGAALCVNGLCSTSAIRCPVGSANCDGNDANGCETTTLDDPLNCGLGGAASAGCGVVCPSAGGSASCHGGVCALACRAGLGDCDTSRSNGCETDLTGSANHCGGCGRVCAVANGTAGCEGGACAVGACNAGFDNCDGAAVNGCETNLRTDRANCGLCEHACAAGQICTGGVCTLSCAVGQTNCFGHCRDLSTDRDNCGGCDFACASGRVCVNGGCSRDCAPGQALCGDTCVNSYTDNENCGGVCGNACTGGTSCQNGRCQCPPDQLACSGVCRLPADDRNNCGGCGIVCPGQTSCRNGVCGCPTGQLACAGVCRAIDRDSNNCGGCGLVCASGSDCIAGVCQPFCPARMAPCNEAAGTICRATDIDPNNCGVCGHSCALPNVVMICMIGECFRAGCRDGFGDCDRQGANGCEVNTFTSPTNCGACGNVCPSGTVCRSGLCMP